MSGPDKSFRNRSERNGDSILAEWPKFRSPRVGLALVAVLISMPFALIAGGLLHHLSGPTGSLEVAALILILCVVWPLFIFRRRHLLATLVVASILASAFLGYQLNDACTGSAGASNLCLSTRSDRDDLLHPQGLLTDRFGL